MSEETWRTYLDATWKLMDAPQKQAFAKDVDVSRQTMSRWRRGDDWPQKSNLLKLLNFLSQGQRTQFLVLLKKDPKAWSLLPEEERGTGVDDAYGNSQLPTFQYGELDTFCLKLLRLQRDTPGLKQDTSNRSWQVGRAILNECLTHLETHPLLVGIDVSVAFCMPPRQDGKVRSLRDFVGIGTPPWREDFHEKDFFLGSESLAGHAVSTRRGQMIPDLAQSASFAPAPRLDHEGSAAAFPIMHVTSEPTLEMTVAGALVATCVQIGYFTGRRMDILEDFADIIRLTLSEEAYQPASHIELAPMPPRNEQIEPLGLLFQRVIAEGKRLRAEGHDHSSKDVEKRVRGEIELELLQRASAPQAETPVSVYPER